MTEIDAAAFEAGVASCKFNQDNLSAAGSSTPAHFSAALGRIYVTANAVLRSARPQAGHTQPAVTVIVEDSANGSSWATVATFNFTASDQQSAAVDSPRAYLRASWASVVGTWAVDVAVKSIASPASGGGSMPFSGFMAYLSSDSYPAGWDADGGPVPYDATSFDTDGYWSAVAKKATIPAGKAGLYAVSHFTYVADVNTLAGVQGLMDLPSSVDTWENGFDHLLAKKLNGGGNAHWDDGITWYGRFAEGDQIEFVIGWWPFTVPSINIANASYLTAILLGNPDA